MVIVGWPRPEAIAYSYSIGAIMGRDTPITPEGPMAVPGDYQVVLKVRSMDSMPIEISYMYHRDLSAQVNPKPEAEK